MKTIAVLIALAMLIAPAVAFPPQPWGNNPEVCKISLDVGNSIVGIYSWWNNETQEWEVKMGIDTNVQSAILPFVMRSDKNGLVEVDFSQYAPGANRYKPYQ